MSRSFNFGMLDIIRLLIAYKLCAQKSHIEKQKQKQKTKKQKEKRTKERKKKEKERERKKKERKKERKKKERKKERTNMVKETTDKQIISFLKLYFLLSTTN